MHRLRSHRLLCAILALLTIFTCVLAYPLAAQVQPIVESQIQQLPGPEVYIQRINPR